MGRKKKEEKLEIDFSKIDEKDIVVDASYYKGNENLLKNDAQIKWTPELIEEFERCAKNILHFSENYFFINTIDDGKKKIELYKYQKKLLRAFRDNRFNIILSSRQSGKCLTFNTLIKIKNKITGEIEEITIGEFYNKFNIKTD
jgi:hypothetical protein